MNVVCICLSLWAVTIIVVSLRYVNRKLFPRVEGDTTVSAR